MKTKLLKTAILAGLIAFSTNLKAYTAVISGSWSNAATWGGIAPGGVISNNDIIIPSGLTVDLDMDASFNGLLNAFTVNGTLNSSTNKSVSIISGSFTGSGTVNMHRLSFDGLLTTASFSGSMSLFSFRNNGASLTLAAVVNVSDTLDLEGGSLVLNGGSNLTMAGNSNIRVNSGTLSTLGGVFTTGNLYDVWYVGASKTTGLEVNSTSLRHLYINLGNTGEILTQGLNNLVVNGNFNLTQGQFALNGNHLTLNGDLTLGTAAILISTATSDITIQGSGMMSSGLMFSTASAVGNFEIDRTGNGNVDLRSALNVAGTIHLANGTFSLQTGAVLTMLAGSMVQIGDGNFVQNSGSFTGTAMYDVEYIGGAQTSGIELSGSGLHDVSIGLSSIQDIITLSNDLTVSGNLDMFSGRLWLNGNNLTIDSSFSQVPVAQILGDSASDITLNLATLITDTIYFGGSQHIHNFTLNLPLSGKIMLATDLTIHNQFDMISGKMEISNANLILRPAAFINGYSDNRYIITSGSGQLQMHVNSNAAFVTFPVGSSGDFAPAQIQQTINGSSGMFKVRAMNGVYTSGTTGYNSAATASVVNKTWLVDASSLVTVNMNIKLGWTLASEVNLFNRTQAYISHYMNSSWDTYPASASAVGLNNTYEIMRTGITSLSPFAVADTSALLSTETLISNTMIRVYPNPVADYVSVETGTGHATYLYELYDVTGKMVYSVSNSQSLTRINLAGFERGLYFIRITDTGTAVTITKRIIKS